MSFANSPPEGNIVADIWAPYMRTPAPADIKMSAEAERKLVKRMKEFTAQKTIMPDESSAEHEDQMITVKRTVRRKRGSWYQVPKDLPDDPEND